MSHIDELIARHCPDGVRHVALSEVAEYSPTRIDAVDLDGTRFVGVDNLVADKGGRIDASYLPNTTRLTAYEPGDILLGNIRPYLKKVWHATNSGGCSGDVLAIRIKQVARVSLTPEFLYYALSSDSFFAYNMQHAKGAKMPRGSKAAILNYVVPVPPHEVQQAIVEILDTFSMLEAELEAERLARLQQYEYYRSRLIEHSLGNETVALGELAEFKYGYTTKATDEGKFRFLRITDISDSGNLLPNDAKFIADTPESRAYETEPGDLLMARTGATFGKTLLVKPEHPPAVFASFLIRIRFGSGRVLPAYYWHFAQSALFWSQANALVSSGGQPQFNGNALKMVKMPVPSIEEQRRVVKVLDQFDALVNDLSVGLPAELAARRQQYEYYRDKLLTFKELEVAS